MEYKAASKMVRVSPRKARMVVAAVKKFSPAVAGEKLQFMGKGAARPIYQTLKSAIANATQGGKVKPEDLRIKNILVDEGIKMKRQDTSRRVSSAYGSGVINKRTSHITVILES